MKQKFKENTRASLGQNNIAQNKFNEMREKMNCHDQFK